MFIQTETTGDPDRLRFLPGRRVLPEGEADRHYADAAAAAGSPLARLLLEVRGVEAVSLEPDAVLVVKAADTAWQHLKPPVLGAIMEHFMSGRPALQDAAGPAVEPGWAPADADAVQRIEQLLKERIRPAIEGYGGDVTLRAFRDGVLLLDLTGAGSTGAGRRQAIANIIRHYLPEVEAVAYEDDMRRPAPAALPPGEPQLDSPEAEAVQRLLDEKINPAIAAHGGYIELLDLRRDTAWIRMGGGCQGCGMADATLRQGVEVEIKAAVPSIAHIVDISEHAAGENPYFR
jgi:Fe-S cluster biogenesis protein NfuA